MFPNICEICCLVLLQKIMIACEDKETSHPNAIYRLSMTATALYKLSIKLGLYLSNTAFQWFCPILLSIINKTKLALLIPSCTYRALYVDLFLSSFEYVNELHLMRCFLEGVSSDYYYFFLFNTPFRAWTLDPSNCCTVNEGGILSRASFRRNLQQLFVIKMYLNVMLCFRSCWNVHSQYESSTNLKWMFASVF